MQIRRALVVGFGLLAACRGILGIDDNRPLVSTDASDEAAAAPLDAGIDASFDARDASPTFCDLVMPAPDFCDDFDHDMLVEYWDNSNRTPDIGASGGGTIAPDLVEYKSPPIGAALSIPALVDKTKAASGFLEKTLHASDVSLADLTIQFDIRITTQDFPSGMGIVPLVALTFGAEQVTVFVVQSGTWVGVGNSGALMKLTSPVIVGQWQTLALSIKNHPWDGGTEGQVNVRIDQLDVAVAPLPPSFQSQTLQKLVVGPITSGPVGAFSMTIDNVLIYARSDL